MASKAAPKFDYAAFGRAVMVIVENTNRRSVNSDDATERDVEALDAILQEADDHRRSARAGKK
jgi:hypothetical protein